MFSQLLVISIPLTIVVFGSLCFHVNGDFPQLHRALPGANGKPGYRLTSSHADNVDTRDNVVYKFGDTRQKPAQSLSGSIFANTNMDWTWQQAAIWSGASCALVGLTGIVPLALPIEIGPSLKNGAGATWLNRMLSFAVGSLLGDVFLHLIPEAWATVGLAENPGRGHIVIGLWVITGLLGFMMLEKFLGETEEDEEEEEEKVATENGEGNGILENNSKKTLSQDGENNLRYRGEANGHVADGHGQSEDIVPPSPAKENNKIHISGYLNLLANFTDNFTHGLAVGGSYLVSQKVGVCTTLAILLHEIPHEVGDFAILLRAGFDRWKAARWQVLTALGVFVGNFTALFASSPTDVGDRTAAILPFTAGGFLYIALVNIAPDLLKKESLKESLAQIFCLLTGVASMLVVTVVFD